MALTFKTVAVGLVIVGLLLGVVFGLGVAYGHTNEKTATGGLTTQQLQQLVGGAAGAGGAGAAGAGAAGAGAAGGAGAQTGAATTNSATAASGRVTAVQGQTVTIQTAAGTSVKVNLGPTTTVSKPTVGAVADLVNGATIFASGTRKDDGSFDATSVAQVPPELQSLVNGTGGARPTTSATPAPAASPGAR